MINLGEFYRVLVSLPAVGEDGVDGAGGQEGDQPLHGVQAVARQSDVPHLALLLQLEQRWDCELDNLLQALTELHVVDLVIISFDNISQCWSDLDQVDVLQSEPLQTVRHAPGDSLLAEVEHAAHVQLVPADLGGEVEGLPGHLPQRSAQHLLRPALAVPRRRVYVVDAGPDHLLDETLCSSTLSHSPLLPPPLSLT